MSIFSLFIGNNKPTVRRKGKRTKAKSYVNKDSVIALKLYNLMITIQSYPTICSSMLCFLRFDRCFIIGWSVASFLR